MIYEINHNNNQNNNLFIQRNFPQSPMALRDKC